jgi:hypothetical protein
MKIASVFLAGAVLVGAVTAALVATGGESRAAQAEGWEYAYIVGVPRLESYDIDVSRWAGENADKDYLKAHVFPYEQGQTVFSEQVGALRKINELAGKGWEVVDAKTGLIRRKR